MGDYEAFTVTKENVEDDRALLNTGVIGTGTAVEKQPILDRYRGTVGWSDFWDEEKIGHSASCAISV